MRCSWWLSLLQLVWCSWWLSVLQLVAQFVVCVAYLPQQYVVDHLDTLWPDKSKFLTAVIKIETAIRAGWLGEYVSCLRHAVSLVSGERIGNGEVCNTYFCKMLTPPYCSSKTYSKGKVSST